MAVLSEIIRHRMDCNGTILVERRKCEQKNEEKEENENLAKFMRKKLEAQREKIARGVS